jgi:tripartite-type tricarboxylate transporter receptor subunit TctC
MKTSRRQWTGRAAAAGLSLLLAWPALSLAQAWPERPVKVIVSSAAGSAPDIVARLILEPLAQSWGKGVVVDNRPGAGGNLGAQAAARSAPDGYTLWFAHATPVVMNQYLFKSPGFDAVRDFTPIVRVGVNPMMIAVHPSVPARNLKELVELSKSRAGKVSFTTSGTRNIPHLVGETLNQLTGAGMVNVPYKGSQQAAQDTAAALAEVYIDAVPPMMPWLASAGGAARLRPLAVTTAQRIEGFDQLPTARESGVDLVMQGWLGFMAPAGVPREVIERVNRDVNAVLQRPDIVLRLRQLGTYQYGGSTAEFDAFIKQERRQWESVVKAARLDAE